MEDTLIFIDEAFLSKLSKNFGHGRYLKFDRVDFAKNILTKMDFENSSLEKQRGEK